MHFAALALPVVTHASFQVDMTLKFRTNIHKRRQLISSAHDMVQIGRMGNTSKATTASRPAGLIWQSITQYPQRSGISAAAQNRGHRWLDWLRIWLSNKLLLLSRTGIKIEIFREKHLLKITKVKKMVVTSQDAIT